MYRLCGTHVILEVCLLISAVRCFHLGVDDNEVIKPSNRPKPKVAPDILEAYYYEAYADVEPSFDPNHGRPGNATDTVSCELVGDVPVELQDGHFMKPHGVSQWYTKYTEAYGIPVLGSRNIADEAMTRACYVLRFLLADREDLRQMYYKKYGRVSIIPKNGKLRDIPEYYFLGDEYDLFTRGLGAVPLAPTSSAGEENILCLDDDLHREEDILLRQIAQGIIHLAARFIDPDFESELEHLYNSAMKSRWWTNTYSVHTKEAYLGEGVQSFFSANAYSSPADGVANSVNTRTKLMTYDSRLYNFVHNLFPCANFYMKRCYSRGNEHFQDLRMNCPRSMWTSSKRLRELRRQRRLNRKDKIRKHRSRKQKSRSQRRKQQSLLSTKLFESSS